MSTTERTVPLRTDALTARVRRRDVKAFFRAFAPRHPALRNHSSLIKRIAAGIGVAMLPIFLLAMALGVSEEIESGEPDAVGQLIGMGSITALMLVGCGFLLYTWLRSRMRRGTPERHFRLARFAADNGMHYLPGPYTADHLRPWADRGQIALTRVIRPFGNQRVEFANFELVRGSAPSRSTQFGGYCAIRLGAALPHIVVKSKAGGVSQLTSQAVPARAQQLSLEGDFDSHFTLYCPAGYERDALYLFTPDIMARLIDSVNGFDVEIVDDWLFLIKTSDVVTLRPATWVGLVEATNALLEKVGRWERWRDDRQPASSAYAPVFSLDSSSTSGVAADGRRLRMGLGKGVLLRGGFGVAFLIAVVLANVLR